jgi:hypothetical protein
MTEKKDWTVQFSDQAQEKMAEDPEAAAAVREQLSRVRQVMAEYEAGRFASVDDALRSIGMEPFEVDDETPENFKTKKAQVKEIARQIIPLLSDQDPDVVGGVLGEMVGLYFAGHNPVIRAEVRAGFDKMVDHVIAIMDEETGGERRLS